MSSKKPAAEQADVKPGVPALPATDPAEQDVEGHFMLPDYTASREIARQREREAQKRAERHQARGRRPSAGEAQAEVARRTHHAPTSIGFLVGAGLDLRDRCRLRGLAPRRLASGRSIGG